MEKRVFFHDTDAGGIVYYGTYLKFLEESRTQFLEARELGIDAFQRKGLIHVVGRVDIRYRSPARYGELLDCRAKLAQVSGIRLMFRQDIHEQASGRRIVEADVTLVCVNARFRPARIPADLRARLVAVSLDGQLRD